MRFCPSRHLEFFVRGAQIQITESWPEYLSVSTCGSMLMICFFRFAAMFEPFCARSLLLREWSTDAKRNFGLFCWALGWERIERSVAVSRSPLSQVRAAVPPAAGGAAAAAAALPRAPPPALPHRAYILRQGPSSAFEITRSERKSQFGIQEQSHRPISPSRERQTTPLGIFR